ncbi:MULTISPECIES: hypothetical protein [unclassified Dietzia]|uniref:hypothetical protein n=1 Tax=unclassified Dietzia TaxID=2617939 RepID=UPI0015FCE1B1|nr:MULTISPECIES: hypothetical protein [unclassified Dietzia]MBB1023692.1 hypothetical protein [Dietzia sp. DQ12-76]MBB1027252.1 hypothetical protein [Dietzia sp. DQ11-38-2]
MTSRTTRSIATGAAALLIASGLSVGTNAAVASAAPSSCATAQTVTFNDPSTLWTDYHLNKEVVGDGTAAPGGMVTFRTTVSGAGALVSGIEDFHPAGFELVQARSSVWYLLGGQTWTTVTNDVIRDSATNSVRYSGAGWTTAGNARATLETTYRVPATATPGDVLNTGAAMTLVLANGRKVANPINTCVTIREPNPTEVVTGSLNGLGLGSVTSGSTALGNIGADPATFSADLINGLDLGQLIGGMAGS